MERSIPLILQWDENVDIDADTGTPVAEDGPVPFRFTGKLDKLTLTLDRPKLTPEDEKKLMMEATGNNKASESPYRQFRAALYRAASFEL